MRKSLLMTSVLGLVMPTLAMANAAAAGSSSAVCGSGFFAQFDAKIMNAKLEIKNAKNTKVEADEATDEKTVADKIRADILSQLSNLGWTVLFKEGTGANRENFITAILDGLDIATSQKTADEVGVAIFNELTRLSTLPAVAAAALTPAQAAVRNAIGTAAALAAVAGPGDGAFRAIAAPAAGSALTAAQKQAIANTLVGLVFHAAADPTAVDAFNDLVGSVQAYGTIAKKAGLKDNLKLSDIEVDFVGKASDRLVVTQTAVEDAVATINRQLSANEILSSYGFSNLTKGYFLALGNPAVANGLADAAVTTAVKSVFTAGAYKTDLETQSKVAGNASVKFNQRVADIIAGNQKINAQLEKRKEYDVTDQRVHHHALAGGVGATVGWWQNLGGFALSISGSGDYLWGTFRTVDDAAGSTVKAEDKRKLGFGFQGDIGAHYIVSPSTTLGILVGLRGQQLNFGRVTDPTKTPPTTAGNKDSRGDYVSKWMINPVVTLQARTFFTDTVYGALSVGYVIPMEKDYKLENTKIDKEAKIRFQGLTGAFSVGMMF